MALSYNLAYQEIISVHPTKRQIFAGKSDSAFWNIWEWVIMKTGANFSLSKTKYYEFAILHASSLQPLEGSRGKRCIKKWFCQAKKKMNQPLCWSVVTARDNLCEWAVGESSKQLPASFTSFTLGFVFIRPESGHCLALSLTDWWLTHSLMISDNQWLSMISMIIDDNQW